MVNADSMNTLMSAVDFAMSLDECDGHTVLTCMKQRHTAPFERQFFKARTAEYAPLEVCEGLHQLTELQGPHGTESAYFIHCPLEDKLAFMARVKETASKLYGLPTCEFDLCESPITDSSD